MGSGKFLNATRGGMEAQLQLVEDKGALHRNGQFAIENETFRGDSLERFDDVRKIAGERLARFRLQENFRAITKRDATEAVPLRLVLPFVADGNFVDGTRLHRGQWRF